MKKTGRIYQDRDDKFVLLWYAPGAELPKYKNGKTREALVRAAKKLGLTHLFDGPYTGQFVHAHAGLTAVDKM